MTVCLCVGYLDLSEARETYLDSHMVRQQNPQEGVEETETA